MTKGQRWQIAAAFLVAPLAFLALPGPASRSTLAPGEVPSAAPFSETVPVTGAVDPVSGSEVAITGATTTLGNPPGTDLAAPAAGSVAIEPSSSLEPAVPPRTQVVGTSPAIVLSDPGAATPTFSTSTASSPSAPAVIPAPASATSGPVAAPTSTLAPSTTTTAGGGLATGSAPATSPTATTTPSARPTTPTTPTTLAITPVTTSRPTPPAPPSTTAAPAPAPPATFIVPAVPPTRPRTEGILVAATDQTPVRSDGVGAFRTICGFSHMASDDPIVAPGRVGGSHLHSFFGNDRTDANSTTESLTNRGGSTCRGGTANRSAYWTPSIVDTATGRAIEPAFVITYYKSGYGGVAPEEIVAMPAGLRIISGDARATAPDASPSWSRPMNWNCGIDSTGTGTAFTTGMQSCAPGQFTRLTISFPQCWNGRDLDSIDHQSHMAWPDPAAGGCPASHPVAIPQITLNFYWPTPAGGNDTWRLSSDMYEGGVAGWSGHADWWNGWDPAVVDIWVERCVRAGLDCSVELLGDGRELVGGLR